MASCLPSCSSRSRRGAALERDQHADLAEARRHRIVDVGDDDAFLRLERGGAAERLVLADRRDVAGQLLLDGPAARPAGMLQRLDVAARAERDRGDGAHELLELLVLGDEVGLAVDLDDAPLSPSTVTPTRPSAAVRPAFFAAAARPLVRSQSIAASMSPPVSPSAFLQSIMPAPVRSRSSFTVAAVISAMSHILLK
jgi:hypothetical protein